MGTAIEVTAKDTRSNAEATIFLDFGETLEESVELFTDAVVHSGFKANAKILAQAAIRRCLKAGKDANTYMANWKPGIQMERISDPIAAVKARYANMNDDEKRAFLADLETL